VNLGWFDSMTMDEVRGEDGRRDLVENLFTTEDDEEMMIGE